MKVKFFVLALSMATAIAQDASDVQAALQRARNNQNPSPASPSSPAPQDAPNPKQSNPATSDLPSYRPGISKLYRMNEVASLQGLGKLSDSWVYGKFTVLTGGPSEHKLILAVPTGPGIGSLSGLFADPSKQTCFAVGWLFKDILMPPIHDHAVLSILPNCPASLVKVQIMQGRLVAEMNLISLPSIEK